MTNSQHPGEHVDRPTTAQLDSMIRELGYVVVPAALAGFVSAIFGLVAGTAIFGGTGEGAVVGLAFTFMAVIAVVTNRLNMLPGRSTDGE